jgi:hypothetical protein
MKNDFEKVVGIFQVFEGEEYWEVLRTKNLRMVKRSVSVCINGSTIAFFQLISLEFHEIFEESIKNIQGTKKVKFQHDCPLFQQT